MHFHRVRALLRLGIILVFLVSLLCLSTNTAPARATTPIPRKLPTVFGFGLSAEPDSSGLGTSPTDTSGWLKNSGIPWTYAYQYLAGGVNTGAGWETWGSACAPWNNNFVGCYVQTAQAQKIIPIFSYYEIQQSSGSCDSCAEAVKDLSNLNNVATMTAYYANFTSLMVQLAATGATAIVHVEPDLAGFVEQSNPNPAATPAAVINTGNADLQGLGLSDTYQGFNQALLHLRDKYAPNVLLAFHVSAWATNTDVASDHRTDLNVSALSQQVATFVKGSGLTGNPASISSWDLLFTDVADKDAATSGNWWDRRNVTFPNFKRWELYIHGIVAATHRRVMVWQVPVGNQYFQSMNNSPGHMQDNRSEYFLAHVRELAHAGIIGVLFGKANPGNSNYFDADKDGITNPSPISTTNGTSKGTITNSHPAAYPDDDGGYIRLFTKAYYRAGPLHLPKTVMP